MKFLIVCVLLCTAFCANAKPAQFQIDNFQSEGQSDVRNCHGLVCPPGTIACSKSTKTSADKRTLLTTLQCEDHHGNVLNSQTKSSENPYDNTRISSFSFTGHYNFNGPSSGMRRPAPTFDNSYYKNNDVETFA